MKNRSHRTMNSVLLFWHGQARCVIASIFVCTLFAFAPLDNRAWAERGAEPQTYVLNTSTGEPYANDAGTGFQDLVVAEVFKRVGLKARVERYAASARALINANEGIDQGVAMRVIGLDKKYPNLVRVDERLIENDFVAYSQNLNFSTDSWQSLEPYVVALINGWVIFERNLSPTQTKTAVTEPDQMFAMLAKNRVDVVLYERWQGLYRARLSGLNVRVHEPPLASVDMYMYVHKDYAHLAPKLAQALRDMKTDGTYQAIFDKTLTPLRHKTDGN